MNIFYFNLNLLQVHHCEILPIVVSMAVSPANVFARDHNTYANKVCFIS